MKIEITEHTATDSEPVKPGDVREVDPRTGIHLIWIGKAKPYGQDDQPPGPGPAGQTPDQNDGHPNKPKRRRRPAG